MNLRGGRKVLLAIAGGVAQIVALLIVVRSIERIALASIAASMTPPPVDWLTVALVVGSFAVPFVGSAGMNAIVHAQRAKHGAGNGTALTNGEPPS